MIGFIFWCLAVYVIARIYAAFFAAAASFFDAIDMPVVFSSLILSCADDAMKSG